ncbi:PREDICTED: E3 ubiquitin-protein ligase RNF144B-like [Camelina sativa]|uniref:RBR-type E3 ubiquitin transferase n=1 Tax=Camelina sativa TaxID=90675 RepID=A0ABM1QEF4_CAMSA|nr:PREDICTED: E3 ubiquitin-protein ligase RNF144B-like [Camelina sativa]
MEAISSKNKIDMPTRIHSKTTCRICFDDINVDEMFYVHPCRHIFCSECVEGHIEVRLSEGYRMTCPRYLCRSELILGNCVNILTPKLKEMWQQRVIDESIPVTDRVYCPIPTCSALMSVSEFDQRTGVRSCCVKCGEHFCIKCKVPWHNNLSCCEYKRSHPNPTENDKKLETLANKKLWRQCSKCQQMIELASGCFFLICRLILSLLHISFNISLILIICI